MIVEYRKQAKLFCEAIKVIASKPENLETLELYLSRHFEAWLEKWADTPDGISSEMRLFAGMD